MSEHPNYIEANIALFYGHRQEVAEWLDRIPENDRGSLLAGWIDTQTSYNSVERLENTKKFLSVHGIDISKDINISETDSIYVQMAKKVVTIDKQYPMESVKTRANRFVRIARLAGMSMIAVLSVIGLIASIVFLLNRGEDVVEQSIISVPEVTPSQIQLPANVEPIASSDVSSVTYEGGRLEVVALERNSRRIINQQNQLLEPVIGGRFFAVQILYECLTGICENPPHAELFVESGGQIESRLESASVAQSDSLQPIAAGNSTSGWVVFQIAESDIVTRLLVRPDVSQDILLTIDLPPG